MRVLLLFAGLALCCFSSNARAQGAEVRQISFCKSRGLVQPTCEGWIIPQEKVSSIHLDELPIDSDGDRHVWVWSRISTTTEVEVAYVFVQENTDKKWSETIHQHWIDKSWEIGEVFYKAFRECLATIHQPEYKFTQGSGFAAREHSMNRWPASFKILGPGVFHLSIVKIGKEAQIVSGGERITLVVKPSNS